jgi:hypothetical protein
MAILYIHTDEVSLGYTLEQGFRPLPFQYTAALGLRTVTVLDGLDGAVLAQPNQADDVVLLARHRIPKALMRHDTRQIKTAAHLIVRGSTRVSPSSLELGNPPLL